MIQSDYDTVSRQLKLSLMIRILATDVKSLKLKVSELESMIQKESFIDSADLPQRIDFLVFLFDFLEKIAKSSLIRGFVIYGTFLGSAWEFAESILGHIPLPLQVFTLSLIFGGAIWVIARLYEKLVSRK